MLRNLRMAPNYDKIYDKIYLDFTRLIDKFSKICLLKIILLK